MTTAIWRARPLRKARSTVTDTSTTTDTEPDPITLGHAPQKHRYEVLDAGTVVGFARYRLPANGNHVDFIHTEVDPAYGGQGLAARLVEFALADVRASGKRIIPHCPYVARYLTRHHEYDDIIDWPFPRM